MRDNFSANQSGRIAIRHGHVKIYCDPHQVNNVVSTLAVSNPIGLPTKGSFGRPNIPEGSLDVVALADSIRLAIASKSSDELPTLYKAVGFLRANGADKHLTRRLGTLNTAASFMRHVSTGWVENTNAELMNALDQVSSMNVDCIGSKPPVPPPPLTEPAIRPAAFNGKLAMEAMLEQSQALITNQNDFIFALSNHANKADNMLQSMISTAASARMQESDLRATLNKIQEKLDAVVDSIASSASSVHAAANSHEFPLNEQAAVHTLQVGVQVTPNYRNAAVGGFQPRWGGSSDPVMISSLTQTEPPDIESESESLVSSRICEESEGVSDESTDSECLSQFEPDEIVDDTSIGSCANDRIDASSHSGESDGDDSFGVRHDRISIMDCKDCELTLRIDGEDSRFQATNTFRRNNQTILIAFDCQGSYREFGESFINDHFVRSCRDSW